MTQPQRIAPEIDTEIAPQAAKAKKLSVAPDADAERLRAFGAAIDEIRERVEAQIGQEDLRYVKKLDRVSRLFEVCGRVLLHVSLDPFTFSAGVVSLWLHKQLQATEIGHTALHGAYDGIEGAEALRVQEVQVGPAHRRGVVARRAQRPPPPVHERRRARSRHPLRPRAAHRAHAARPQRNAHPVGADRAASSSRTSRSS